MGSVSLVFESPQKTALPYLEHTPCWINPDGQGHLVGPKNCTGSTINGEKKIINVTSDIMTQITVSLLLKYILGFSYKIALQELCLKLLFTQSIQPVLLLKAIIF